MVSLTGPPHKTKPLVFLSFIINTQKIVDVLRRHLEDLLVRILQNALKMGGDEGRVWIISMLKKALSDGSELDY